ncbi:AAA family ATPase [Nitrospira sp. MA-1]|nr:AAA family ATPase [Nitrospira sp. MA-1]
MTKTDVQTDIVQWLHSQPDWLQEAAEQLLEHGELHDKTIRRLSERLKILDAQEKTTHRAFPGLATEPSSSCALRLGSIGDVRGIENLSPHKPLDFGLGNLTVIYGPNGSGKSSYTRILKKACGKPRAIDLKPNVFQEPPPLRQCEITFTPNGISPPIKWVANSSPIPGLEQVDIFDGDAAGFYLSEESEVSYSPPEVALFEELAQTVDKIKALLQSEQDQLVNKQPILPPEYTKTPAGETYQALKPGQTEASLKNILEWSECDQATLDQLAERLKSEDPGSLAKQKRARKKQLDQIATELSIASSAVSKQAFIQLQELRKTAEDHRRRAIEAAKANTASGKLEGIGTDTWIALWEAAKVYSTGQAYPGQEFPYTGDDARCVLCHQPLDVEAKQRMMEFEAFVQGKIEADARVAEETYLKAIESLPSRPSEEEIRTSCQAAWLKEEDWLDKLKGFWQGIQVVCNNYKKSESSDAIDALAAATELVDVLSTMSQALEAEAVQHETDARLFDREKALNQKVELEAKRFTSQQATAIRDEIDRLGKFSTFEEWKKRANSREISLKAGDISEKTITKAYVERFNAELRTLGAARIKVELVKTRTERGKVKHRVRLRGVTSHRETPGSVLSDGERRVVALAAFLADVSGKHHHAPFVFDDPISSLDHDFEWEVAMRLAMLAKDRQVIVFTHRLSLYGAMEDAAKKCGEEWRKEHLTQLCIEAFAGSAGHPAKEGVWNANTTKANNILVTRLDEAKKFFNAKDSESYKIHAQAICTEFRKLLERTVEDDLLNQVVKRHRRSVTTDNRITQLPKITNDDCAIIDGLMTKYSCYEHSQSQEIPTFLPDEPELRQDLEKLKNWRKSFKERSV